MSTIKVDTVQSTGGGAVTLTKQEGAKVRALHRDQVLQSGSLNHSSLTDNATGDFTHNFTTSFANTIYSISAHCHYTVSTTSSGIYYNGKAGTERTASNITMESYYMNASENRSKLDMDDCDLICFGDLA